MWNCMHQMYGRTKRHWISVQVTCGHTFNKEGVCGIIEVYKLRNDDAVDDDEEENEE